MNWVESSVLLMLGICSGIYLILVFLTSPGRARRERRSARAYRPADPRDGYDSLRPRELRAVSDEELAEFVRNRLRLRPGLSGVEVSVEGGNARLSGRTTSVDDRELAGNVARSVPQVRSVVNEVRVRREAVA